VNDVTRKAAHRRTAARARSSGHGTSRPTIALCLIAKNEERFIADCLDSAREFVDEMIVVDTGSTDRTREIARERGARVEEFVWCDDFAAARNASIDAATADWILVLDADERLDPTSGKVLQDIVRTTPPTVHALAPIIENRTLTDATVLSSTGSVPRIFRRQPHVRFVGAIHEVVVYTPDRARTVIWLAQEVRIIHYGYDARVYVERSKDTRNVTLLEQELARGSEDARLPFFLLEQHSSSGRDMEAVAAFQLFTQKAATLPPTFWVDAYNFYLKSLSRLGEMSKLETAEIEAVERNALGAASLTFLSEFYAERGDLNHAIDLLERLLNEPVPEGLQHLRGMAEWQTRLKLAALHQQRNGSADGAKALRCAAEAYAASPRDQRAGIALETAAAALRLDNVELAATWAGRALRHAPQTEVRQREVLDLLVRIYARDASAEVPNAFATIDRALARDDLQSMYDQAWDLPLTMAGIVRCVAVVEALRGAGEAEAALGLLNRVLDGPRVEGVYWLLVRTLTDLGRYEEAQLALEALSSSNTQQRTAA
jgi:glycosyltransferase involved in cell wall biosynthesis